MVFFVPVWFFFFLNDLLDLCVVAVFLPSFEAAVRRNSDAPGLLHGSAQAGSQLVLLFCWCPVTSKTCFSFLSFCTYVKKKIGFLLIFSIMGHVFIHPGSVGSSADLFLSLEKKHNTLCQTVWLSLGSDQEWSGLGCDCWSCCSSRLSPAWTDWGSIPDHWPKECFSSYVRATAIIQFVWVFQKIKS